MTSPRSCPSSRSASPVKFTSVTTDAADGRNRRVRVARHQEHPERLVVVHRLVSHMHDPTHALALQVLCARRCTRWARSCPPPRRSGSSRTEPRARACSRSARRAPVTVSSDAASSFATCALSHSEACAGRGR
jgi:hypothetical protein